MAIQIWDAQAGQYKSADLARFGGAGTLTEALVWDGTQYVKVWPSGPSYPLTGEWSGSINGDTVEIHRWTVPETGEWTLGIEASTTSTQTLQAVIVLNDPVNGDYLASDMRFDPGSVAGVHTGTLQAGDTVYWKMFNYPSGHVDATWSITKQ